MDYPFANGTIKALENKIQDRNKLYVLSKYDKSEFVKVLLAMNYGGTGNTVEELIKAENNKVRELINSITPNIDDTNLFYIVNDAQNIKILYKIKKFSLNRYELLQDGSGIEKENLTNAIINDDLKMLNKAEKGLIKELNKKLESIDNPKILSSIIDNEIYNYAINKTKNQILITYLKTKIDITNVISMIRAHNLKWNKDQYFEMFIDGGKISKDVFNEIYNEVEEKQIKKLSEYYNEQISKVLISNKELSTLEISFDRLVLDIMSLYRHDPFTIGPMIYYYLLKEAEAQNIRILYSTKKVDIKDLI